MNTNTYVIASISELNNVDYSQVSQTSAETVRKNTEMTKFILKYDGSRPSTIESLDTNGKLISYDNNKYFTHPQILNIVKDVEWVGTQSFPYGV
jgi:hypothetical protein